MKKMIKRYNALPVALGPTSKRVFIAVPLTGLIRAEWMMARYGQGIPTNWSHTEFAQWIDQLSPLGFMVADARNVSVNEFIKGGWEWLFFIDHDVVMPVDTFSRWNQRMLKADCPIWGGLYFTKSVPSEPLVYREWGNSYYTDWKIGEEVWVKGMGLGCNVIHRSILKTVWDESEEYNVAGQIVRRVFDTPNMSYIDPEDNMWKTSGGTEDIVFYNRLIKNGYLEKAGWKKHQKMPYPYLMDSNVFCRHIDWNGVQYPSRGEERQFLPKPKRAKR